MKLSTYLYFGGNCKEALEFYERVAGGKVTFAMAYKDAPPDSRMDPAMDDKIMHASMELGGQVVMASDVSSERFTRPGGFSACLETDSVEEAQRIFAAFAEGGSVTMPITPTFWSPMFGMVTDRFGTPWIVNAPGEPQQ